MGKFKWNREQQTEGYRKVADKNSTAVVYIQDQGDGFYYVKAFQAKRQKPDYFVKVKKLEQFIARFFKDVQETETYKAKWKAEADAKCAAIEVGDIYYTSWGYEQTNVDFVMVTARTPKTVKYVAIGKGLDHNDGANCDFVAPDTNRQGKREHTAKVTAWGFKAFGYPATKYEGKPVYETAAGWGH